MFVALILWSRQFVPSSPVSKIQHFDDFKHLTVFISRCNFTFKTSTKLTLSFTKYKWFCPTLNKIHFIRFTWIESFSILYILFYAYDFLRLIFERPWCELVRLLWSLRSHWIATTPIHGIYTFCSNSSQFQWLSTYDINCCGEIPWIFEYISCLISETGFL